MIPQVFLRQEFYCLTSQNGQNGVRIPASTVLNSVRFRLSVFLTKACTEKDFSRPLVTRVISRHAQKMANTEYFMHNAPTISTKKDLGYIK
jgi:hypothetical protein